MIRAGAWSLLHQTAGRGGMFVFFLALPVVLPIDAVGRFTFWYTVLLVAAQPFFEVGLGTTVTKAVARADWSRARAALELAVPSVLVVLLLLLVLAGSAGAPSPMILWLAAAVGANLFLSLFYAARRGAGDFLPEGIAGTLGKLSAPCLLLWAAAAGWDTEHGAAAALAASVGVAWAVAVLGLPGRWRALCSALRVEGTARGPVAREAAVLGAAALVGMLSFRLDVLVLGLLRDAAGVGTYFTAFKWLDAAFVVPHAAMLVVLPRLAADREPRRTMRPLLLGAVGLGVVATAGTLALARWGLPLIYGAEAESMREVLTILALAVVPVYCGILLTQGLIATDRSRAYLIIASVGLAANLAGDLLLVPRFGAPGAAIATVVSETLIALACVGAFYRSGSPGSREIAA